MSVVDNGPSLTGLAGRVRAILTRPSATWDEIDGESATIKGLYTGYVAPLVAIPAVCGLIGALVIGYNGVGFTYRPPAAPTIAMVAVGYLLQLGMVYVLALIIEALAPSFGGAKDRTQAFKVAAYSGTAGWVAGVFSLAPMLAVVGAILSLYSLYLLYTGLPKLMKAPKDKALAYTAVIVITTIVLSLVVAALTRPIMGAGGGMMG